MTDDEVLESLERTVATPFSFVTFNHDPAHAGLVDAAIAVNGLYGVRRGPGLVVVYPSRAAWRRANRGVR